jgi:hypothetical protein
MERRLPFLYICVGEGEVEPPPNVPHPLLGHPTPSGLRGAAHLLPFLHVAPLAGCHMVAH